MIGTRIELVYTEQSGVPAQTVEITHYALGRLARWARANGVPGLSPETAEGMADRVLCIQVCSWAEVTRGMSPPPDFDAWVAKVEDFNPVEEPAELDPTQPAT